MPPMLVRILLIAAAGACGAVARYGLSGLAQRLAGSSWPLGTWTVNVLGSLLFGVIWAMAMTNERVIIGAETRIILLIGFMGAFTTFSTLSFETAQMLGKGQWVLAGVNAGGQVVVGLGAVFVGMALGRLI